MIRHNAAVLCCILYVFCVRVRVCENKIFKYLSKKLDKFFEI